MAGYDGGDCCECTCIVDSLYPCDEEQYYECLDPNAPCHGYEEFAYTELDEDDYLADIGSYYFSPCTVGSIGDGECDNENNSEECGEPNKPYVAQSRPFFMERYINKPRKQGPTAVDNLFVYLEPIREMIHISMYHRFYRDVITITSGGVRRVE